MDISSIKGIILVLMFLVTFVCSMIPVCFVNHIHHTHDSNRRSKYHHILSFMSCIAGGVFMGTCILDLFPDVQEQIDILLSQYTISRPFPVAEFIVVFGFLLVLTLEQIVLDYKEKSLALEINSETETLLHNHENVRGNLQLEHSLSGISDHPDLLASLRENERCARGVRTYGAVPRSCDGTDEHEHTEIFDHSIHQDISSHSPLRSFLLLFALSLHSVFEGMAVGLQSTIDNLLALFMVVIFHKGTLALSLSINMVQSRLSLKQMMLGNLFFCITAPIGVGIGLGIMELKHSVSTTLLSGVLQGIACGTFLYVTFFEVLPHEMNNGENRLIKLFFILLGFTIICAMLYIAPEDEKYHCYRG